MIHPELKSRIEVFMEDAKKLAENNGVTLDQVLKVFEIFSSEKRNENIYTAYIDRRDSKINNSIHLYSLTDTINQQGTAVNRNLTALIEKINKPEKNYYCLYVLVFFILALIFVIVKYNLLY